MCVCTYVFVDVDSGLAGSTAAPHADSGSGSDLASDGSPVGASFVVLTHAPHDVDGNTDPATHAAPDAGPAPVDAPAADGSGASGVEPSTGSPHQDSQ